MKRRTFLKQTALATAGMIAAPYILPSGRLFAATGSRTANHVVVCLFAGGVRNLEAMHKADGNLMPNILPGNESISADIAPAMTNLPAAGTPLQTQGTLFREFRFKQGPTGHYSGHSTALTGQYNLNGISLALRPQTPTVFEYYRKHSSPDQAALNSWWVSDSLGPYPGLNFSDYPGYGALYGANYVQPSSLIQGMPQNPVQLDDVSLDKVAQMRDFLDKNFSARVSAADAGILNSEADREQLEAFLRREYDAALAGAYNNFWGLSASAINNDLVTMFFAQKVIEEFTPELLVVNMQGIDVAHTNFTAYCNNIRKADYALAQLWQAIQNTPGMANDTILIAVPEHGRNLQPNTVRDIYGRFALDHTSDETSREIFCLVLGPAGMVNQNNMISTEVGESIDIVPTVARILGFDTDIPGGYLQEAFV